MKKPQQIFTFLLAASLAFTSMPITAQAETGTKPADGTTIAQPFPSGTGGSQNFRIPGIVTLNDGTLVAACDARWNHAGDACGLDTIVSRSTDNGTTWDYTFANYLGDNGNQYHAYSTAFIDPAIATDGETVYMIADVWPGGYAINTAPKAPVAGQNGLDEEGNLRLSDDNRSTYAYHLEKSEEGDGYVITENESGAILDEYTVDAYFNITGNGVDSNLFYSDSPYLVYPTDYLYLTSSKDGGATWSVPSLLNIKKPSEQTLLVGPGRGIVTSTGRIVFTAYEWTQGDRNSACFYSDDQGKTWTRGNSVSSISSEAAVVEADGKLYMFTRHGGYYVSDDWGESWSGRIDPGISYNLNCELSAITYSKKIDGKTAIILSAPSNTGSRAAGKLFIGLVQNDGSISWDYSYSINGDAYYAYSCLTELNDGSIGLLYENASAAITYTNIPLAKAAPGAFAGDLWCSDASGNITASVNMKSNSSISLQVGSAYENAILSASSGNRELLSAHILGSTLTITSSALAADMERGSITLTDGANTLTLTVNVTDAQQYEIVDLRMGDIYTVAGYNGETVLGGDTSIVKVTKGSDTLSIEALAEGKTTVKVGGKAYYVIVKNDEQDLKLKEGESVTIPCSAILREADKKIVSTVQNKFPYPYQTVSSVADGGKYLIGTASHIVTSADSTDKNPVGRAMQGANFYSADLTEFLWTLTADGDGYTIQNEDGQYLTFDGTSVLLSDTPQTLAVNEKPNGFSVSYETIYLNNYAGANVRAAGYAQDNNTWSFYQSAETLTITGISEGRTTLVVDGTTYRITVGDPLPEDVGRALASLQQKLSAADPLLAQSGLYTEASVLKLKTAYDEAKAVLANPKAQTFATVNAALAKLEQAMNLELKPADGNDNSNNQQPPKDDLPAVKSTYSDKTAVYLVTASNASGGTVSFVKSKKKSPKTITVPASIKIKNRTYKVTAIENNACKGNKKLTQVTIGANVKKIGKSAFEGCSKLKKITIQSNALKSVGKKAIKGIDKKCSIRVPKKKISAYKNLFKGKGWKSTMKVVKK